MTPIQENTNTIISDNPESGKLNVWLPLLFAITAVSCILLGFQLQKSTAKTSSATPIQRLTGGKEIGKIEEMIRYIEAKYVDETERKELLETAINNMLDELDPHSSYIPKEELEAVNNSLEGSFEGVGIQFYILNDTIYVIAPLAGGPSEKVGILGGDKIVRINDSLVAGVEVKNETVYELLRGEKGSEVDVSIKRGNQEELIDFTIKRDQIPDFSVDCHYMVDDEIAYIKINRFSSSTYEEFMKGIEDLDEKGFKHLIIDLRQNPGGYLSAATKIADQLFTNPKQLLVYTEGRNAKRSEYKTTGRNFYQIGKVMVLIDEGSASASEILAGAIQDWDRGTIIGRRSYGKGLVQEQYKLSDGSALRLTVARYFTPSGRSIQKPYKGVGDDYKNDGADRMNSGEFFNQDSIKITDSTEYQTASGRIVFGGGGITPDKFVAMDTIVHNPFYLKSQQYLPDYIYDYIDKNRTKLKAFETIKDFDKNFTEIETITNEFVKFVIEKGTKYKDGEIQNSRKAIRQRLKAFIAKELFKEEGFYQILNKVDPVFLKAIEEIR